MERTVNKTVASRRETEITLCKVQRYMCTPKGDAWEAADHILHFWSHVTPSTKVAHEIWRKNKKDAVSRARSLREMQLCKARRRSFFRNNNAVTWLEKLGEEQPCIPWSKSFLSKERCCQCHRNKDPPSEKCKGWIPTFEAIKVETATTCRGAGGPSLFLHPLQPSLHSRWTPGFTC